MNLNLQNILHYNIGTKIFSFQNLTKKLRNLINLKTNLWETVLAEFEQKVLVWVRSMAHLSVFNGLGWTWVLEQVLISDEVLKALNARKLAGLIPCQVWKVLNNSIESNDDKREIMPKNLKTCHFILKVLEKPKNFLGWNFNTEIECKLKFRLPFENRKKIARVKSYSHSQGVWIPNGIHNTVRVKCWTVKIVLIPLVQVKYKPWF